jgi:ABC-type sugar transport system substrate-binding protein
MLTGCQPEVGVPGATGTTLPEAPEPKPVSAIGLVMPSRDVLGASVYEQVFRHEAAQRGIVCDTILSEPGREAEAVREMAGRGVSALVVVPATDEREEVGTALAEARAKGLPILMLERDAPAGEPGLPLVGFSPDDEAARALVEHASKAARDAGYPEDVKAVLLINGPFDVLGRQKVAALHQALEQAHIEALPDLHFEGFQKEARAVLDPLLKEHPEVGIVLAIEDQGVMTAASARDEADPKGRRFVFAGFVNSPDTTKMTEFGLSAAVAEQRIPRLAKRAFDAAFALAEGQSPPQDLTVQTTVVLPEGEEREGFFPRVRPGNAVE